MPKWDFWGWIAYSCLWVAAIISAADVALKMAPSAAPAILASESWHYFVLLPFTCMLIATFIFLAKQVGWISVLVDETELQLETYRDDRTPSRTGFKNIWRWFFLRSIFVHLERDGQRRELESSSLHVSFDKPVKVGTLFVRSNATLPRYEFKEFNSRFAIIACLEKLPACTLEIRVHQ